MGCYTSRFRDQSDVIRISKKKVKKNKLKKDLYAPFEPDDALSKAYFDNIHALRSEGVRYGILEEATSDSFQQELNNPTVDFRLAKPSRSFTQCREKGVLKSIEVENDKGKAADPDCGPLSPRPFHTAETTTAFYCFPLSMLSPISEGKLVCMRLATMVLSMERRDPTLRISSASEPSSEEPAVAALLANKIRSLYANNDEGVVYAREVLMKRGGTNLDQANVQLHPSTDSLTQHEPPPSSSFYSYFVHSSKRDRRRSNQHHLQPVRRFLVAAKEIRFTTEHPREKVLKHLWNHMRRWSDLSAHSLFLLRYLHMECIHVNEVESLPFSNSGLSSQNASEVRCMGAKRDKGKGSKGSLLNSDISREGMKKCLKPSLTDSACPVSCGVTGVRIYTELVRHGTLHTLKTREMPSLYGRSYLHELTARVCMRDVLLGLFFIHENGELQRELSARSIFLRQPVCSVYKTYFPAYISEVPAGDLSLVPPKKFRSVLRLLDPKPSMLQEQQGDPSSSFDTPTPFGSFHEDQENNPCNSVRSDDLVNKSFERSNPKFMTSGSGEIINPDSSLMNNTLPNANKSVGFKLTRSTVFNKWNKNSSLSNKSRSSVIASSIKANGRQRQEIPTQSSLSTPNSAPVQNNCGGEAGVRLAGRMPRFPFSRGQGERCWDSLAFRQVEQIYGLEECDPPRVPFMPTEFADLRGNVHDSSEAEALPMSETVKSPLKVDSFASIYSTRCADAALPVGRVGNQGQKATPRVVCLLTTPSSAPPPLLLAPPCNDQLLSGGRHSSSIRRLSVTGARNDHLHSSRRPTMVHDAGRKDHSASTASPEASWGRPCRDRSLIRLSQSSAIRRCMALRRGSLDEVAPASFMSVAHAAPEVLARGQFSPASDIYAFAMTFVELVTPAARARATAPPSCDGPADVALPGQLSDACREMLRACLHPDPQRRPTALELLQGKYFLLGGWIGPRAGEGGGPPAGDLDVRLPERPWGGDVCFEAVAQEAGFPVLPSDFYAPLPGIAPQALNMGSL